MKRKVRATTFTDAIGYKTNQDESGQWHNRLDDGGDYYAELSNDPKAQDFSALGNLKFGHKLRITYNGIQITASKRDVGAGGAEHPKIDLHEHLAHRLGIFDLDNFNQEVEIEDA